MKIFLLGANGMIGHSLADELSAYHDVVATYRGSREEYIQCERRFREEYDVDVRNLERIRQLIEDFRPQVVVNAAGIVKQRPASRDALTCLEINAVFPHKLNKACEELGIKFVQVSTDCVFSGQKGNYLETDISDAQDIYGRTKYLGEVESPNSLTIRTSTIGLETAGNKGLIEWFLSQKGEIHGYRGAIYSGLITQEFVKVVSLLLERHFDLSGLFHVASTPISKYDLLLGLKQRLERKDMTLLLDEEFFCDRSLVAQKLAEATGYVAPSWDKMLNDLADQIRRRM